MWTVEFGHRIRKIVKNSRKRICRERSVYSAIRPMAVCAKLLGTFPLSGVLYHKADKLNFSICSCGTLWGAILFSAIITLVIYVSYYFIPFSQLNTFNFWKTIYCWLLMARSILQFLFCHKCARNIPGLLKLLDKSYICRQTDTVVRPWKTMPFLVIIIHIAFIVYLDIEFFGTLLPPDQLTYFTAGLYSLLRIWQIVPLTMYVNICRIMIQGFHLIEQKVDEVLILLEPFYKNDPADVINREEARKMTEKLEWIRLEHALLNKATETLSQSYGILLLVDYTSMTVVMIVQLYVIAVYEVDVVFLLCAISNFLFGTSAIHVSHVLSKSVSMKFYNKSLIRTLISIFLNRAKLHWIIFSPFQCSNYIEIFDTKYECFKIK